MSALSEMLTQANGGSLSLQRITDLMRERGHDIGKDTVWKYMSGRHTVVTTQYLRAFVDVFPSLKLGALERVALLPPDLGEWFPPAEAHVLTQREREALEVLIKSMARGKGEEEAHFGNLHALFAHPPAGEDTDERNAIEAAEVHDEPAVSEPEEFP